MVLRGNTHPVQQSRVCADRAMSAAGERVALGDRIFAWFMANVAPKAEWRFRDQKQQLFAGLRRDQGIRTVVEVGMGAAPNLQFYAAHVDRVIGVDINAAMHPYARKAADRCKAGGKLQLLTGAAEALPLPDRSADAIVMTHVLCSVQDPQQALAEARRALRPGGKLLFLEHVAAPPGQPLERWQRWLNPAAQLLGRGCNVTRHTLAALQRAGFASLEAQSFRLRVWGPAALISPHIFGTAVT